MEKKLIGLFIIIPTLCPYCNIGCVGLKNVENENNPLQGKCHYYKCTRNLNLRKGTIFESHPKTPLSVLYKVMKYWINENKNVKHIKCKLEEDYNIENVDTRVIYAFVSNLRKAIATHLRNTYILDRLANINANQRIAFDESLFTHNANIQQWVVGLINIDTKEIRLELVSNRNQNTLKYIIEKHVGRGNIINTDSWAGYNFISNVN